MTTQPNPSTPDPHHIIIVGGGAGGLELATRLGDQFKRKRKAAARVTLVDRGTTHIWKPLLHEVAAGAMDPYTHQIPYAAQASWHGFEFQQGEMLGLNRASRLLHIAAVFDEDGMQVLPERHLPYDTLVLAIGSVTNFFNVPGTQTYALPLDTPEQAERFRRRLISACMRAEYRFEAMVAEQPADLLTRPKVSVAIIGAGATGVELSAELRNTAQVLSAYGLHRMDPRHDVRLVLIEAGPRILPALPTRVSEGVTALLGQLDVDVLTEERVVQVTADAVITASGRHIPADITVWAAGIRAPAVLSTLDGLQTTRGLIDVEQTLQSRSDPHIFALGDCANCLWEAKGIPVPPRAQSAHQQASHLAKTLVARLQGKPLAPFQFTDLGSLVSLGRFSAVGSLMGGIVGGNMLIEGLIARYMYTSLYRMHILALHGWWGMVLDTLGHWLRSKTTPRVKLH